MQELTGLPKVKTIIGARLLFRYQNVRQKVDKRPVPSWPSSTSTPPDVRKEERFGGISVVIENPLAAIDKHMVTYMSGR
jgi:hypothetical protein